MKLTFLGGAGTVTGCRYLIEDNWRKILIDCGLFEGAKTLRVKNWLPFPVDPSTLDAVILTHAYLDHSGYLPRLVKEGFAGPIFCTGGTRDLCHLLLKDSARLMEEQADYFNRHKLSKHKPALPLYTVDDVENSLPLFRSKHFNTTFEAAGLHFEFRQSGHILGSAHLRVTNQKNVRVTFTGDVGRSEDNIMRPPESLLPTDFLVIESVLGGTIHSDQDVKTELRLRIIECLSKGGSLLLPAYSTGRTQQILHALYLLKKNREIPRVPVFLDSPMSSDIAYLYCAYRNEHSMEDQICTAIFDDVYFARTPQESRKIAEHTDSKIIISASSMATGGRVLHHLKRMAADERNTILFTGFQAAGTRGATLLGQAPFVKIFGEYIKIKARIANIENFSAHADANELASWIKQSRIQPQHVFITHCEVSAAEALKKKLNAEFGWNCLLPHLNDSVVLESLNTSEERYEIYN